MVNCCTGPYAFTAMTYMSMTYIRKGSYNRRNESTHVDTSTFHANGQFIAAQCDSILTPDGGNVTLVTNGTQTLAVYTCGVGSSLDGEANPECQEDGTWQYSEPICGK